MGRQAVIPAIIIVYMAACTAIGLWAIRRNRDGRDFFLAGGRLGLFTTVLATMSSIMSGFVFVGGPGLFNSVGLASFWIVISSSFTGAMMCWLLAKPLHRLAREAGCLSIPDVIHARYGCRFSSAAATAAILMGVIGYLGTQLLALGILLGPVLGISLESGLLLGASVLLLYTTCGGMVAAVRTDVLQGFVMLTCAVALFCFAVNVGGGIGNMSAGILREAPSILSPWGSVGVFTAQSWFLLFAIGSLGQPHVVQKFMMVRDLSVLRHFPWILALSMMLCGLIWLGGGLVTKYLALTGQLRFSQPDQAISTFLVGFAPSWLTGLTYAGILSAIMSTADSLTNIGSAALTRDLPAALGLRIRPRLIWARLFTILIFALAALFALYMKTFVAYLGVLAFGVFACALTPVLALGLNWERPNRWASRLSIVFGVVSCVVFEVLSRTGHYSIRLSPAALSLALSFLVFILAGFLLAKERSKESTMNRRDFLKASAAASAAVTLGNAHAQTHEPESAVIQSVLGPLPVCTTGCHASARTPARGFHWR